MPAARRGGRSPLSCFLTELRAALEPYGTKVSLLVDGRLLTAEGDPAYAETTGLDLTELLPLVDAVYTETADLEAAQAALEALAGEGEAPALVSLTAAPAEGSDGGTEALPAAGNWYIPLTGDVLAAPGTGLLKTGSRVFSPKYSQNLNGLVKNATMNLYISSKS